MREPRHLFIREPDRLQADRTALLALGLLWGTGIHHDEGRAVTLLYLVTCLLVVGLHTKPRWPNGAFWAPTLFWVSGSVLGAAFPDVAVLSVLWFPFHWFVILPWTWGQPYKIRPFIHPDEWWPGVKTYHELMRTLAQQNGRQYWFRSRLLWSLWSCRRHYCRTWFRDLHLMGEVDR